LTFPTPETHPDEPQAAPVPAASADTDTQARKDEERDEREELLRAELEPLGEDERPPALRVAIAVCALLALAVILGATTIHNLNQHGGSLPGGVFLAVVLLAFQIIVTSLALIVASTILAAVICVVSIGLGGWLFWKLVRVMSRIQAGEQGPAETLR